MALDTFDTLDEALMAYAHLVGFVVQTFADNIGVSTDDVVALVRRRLDSLDA